MIALMNSMIPWPMRIDFRKYVVPSTIFLDPPISVVGRSGRDLDAAGVKYRVVEMKYSDYGAANAESIGSGFVRIYVSRGLGRILGASVAGQGSGEMINQWALAIQKKMTMKDILFLQHSFPTMGYLNKMISERWMMDLMAQKPWMRKAAQICYKLF